MESGTLTDVSGNLQGWSIDEGHPLHDKFANGGVWLFLTNHLNTPLSEYFTAAITYLCAHASTILQDYPPGSQHTEVLAAFLEHDWCTASEEMLLDAVLEHARMKGTNDEYNTSTLRLLVPHIRLERLSVSAVLNALEPAGVLSEDELLNYYRDAALKVRRPSSRGDAVMCEGEHPYTGDDDGYFDQVRLGRAKKMVVEFDRRTIIGNGARLILWADRDCTKCVGEMGNGWGRRSSGVRYLTVEGNELFAEFRCAANATPAWGWKMLVKEIVQD